jgi:hypothetical protein
MKRILTTSFSFLLLACSTITYGQRAKTTSVEDPASTEKIVERTLYNFKYYSTWKIDTADADYDPDKFLSLDSRSNNGFVTIVIFNEPSDVKTNVNEQVKEHLSNAIKKGIVTRFTTWGKYKGAGATIKGKLLGGEKGEIKIFSYSNKASSFLVVSQIFDSDKKVDLPGLQFIEKTFSLN